ncbi:restriction endonuclease subunit S [Marinilactibacillus psychrotolerans]|uniref:Restriction endonuclease subunit S n=1 Tax=Marinilactibacillus psychrotolerans TaxID=191770 RepID=A0ABW8UJ41_9LACT
MNSKSPEIRFNGFTDDWEQRKLKDVSTYSNGGSYENDVSELGKYQLVTLKSIDMSGNLVDSGRFIDKDVSTLDKGTLVMILSEQSPGLLGMTAQIPKNNYYVLNQRVAEISPKNNIDSYFLSMSINKNQRYFSRLGAGTKVQNISKSNVENYELSSPTLFEQRKIGIFFKHIDNTIALHQRELEILEKSKEGFLQKMFPKKGEIVPEIRLTNYTNNWKKEKLGNLVQWKRGKGLPKKSLNTIGNGKPVIHYADLYFFPAAISKVKHYSEENEGYLIKQNSLLFPMSDVTPNGLARTSSIQLRGVYAGGDTLIAELNEVNSDFLSYQINANSNKIMKYVTGTTIKHINSKSLSQLTVYITNKQEQEKIGSFLKKIDEKFFYHEEQLIILKQAKKAFLQKMFV